jgi:hypothetical protein
MSADQHGRYDQDIRSAMAEVTNTFAAPTSTEAILQPQIFTACRTPYGLGFSRVLCGMPICIINAARQFETTNGALRFPELTASPPMLLGRSIFEHSKIDCSINPAATETNFPLRYGDFQQMVIVDRIGSTFQLVPHLVDSNRRSTGQRVAQLWLRTGSDVVVRQAFRLLPIPTTAQSEPPRWAALDCSSLSSPLRA